jgi:hypothetical protein
MHDMNTRTIRPWMSFPSARLLKRLCHGGHEQSEPNASPDDELNHTTPSKVTNAVGLETVLMY